MCIRDSLTISGNATALIETYSSADDGEITGLGDEAIVLDNLSLDAADLNRLNLETDIAIDAYSKCIYLDYGRAWDPNGWFWSPSADCADKAKKYLK